MFIDEIPSKKIGYLAPRHVIDNGPYEFYRLAPPGVMLVMVSCGLNEFSLEDVERVFKSLDRKLDLLMERDVDIYSQTGIPLPCLLGIEAHDALIKHIADYTGRPATSQLHNVMAALKHLGLKKIIVANKWTDQMNENLQKFLDREGISVVGVYNKSLTPSEFSKIKAKDSAQLAYSLGIRGLKEHPEADGLFIGGGNWMSQPVVEQIEQETGKPAVCNIGGMIWAMLHHIGMWHPIPGHGRLLSGD